MQNLQPESTYECLVQVQYYTELHYAVGPKSI